MPTGDPRFVVPGSMLSKTAAFTANFSTTLTYQARASKSNPYGPVQQVTFSTRPGTSTAISVNFDRPSNALAVLFVPMGDAAKTYNTQWTTTGQQALQDGMTAAVSREYKLRQIGIRGRSPLRSCADPHHRDGSTCSTRAKFGNGANYDVIQPHASWSVLQTRLIRTRRRTGSWGRRLAVGIDGLPQSALLRGDGGRTRSRRAPRSRVAPDS
jgi:hypothetical protein